MLKNQLADELRQRQYKYGKVERKLIAVLSDDQIIDSYITCSCCGEKQVSDDTGICRIMWFHGGYLRGQLQPGQMLMAWGKVGEYAESEDEIDGEIRDLMRILEAGTG
jgi:hypothetical protein